MAKRNTLDERIAKLALTKARDTAVVVARDRFDTAKRLLTKGDFEGAANEAKLGIAALMAAPAKPAAAVAPAAPEPSPQLELAAAQPEHERQADAAL